MERIGMREHLWFYEGTGDLHVNSFFDAEDPPALHVFAYIQVNPF